MPFAGNSVIVGYVRISKHLLSLSPEVFYFLVCYGVVKVPPLLQYVVFVAPVIIIILLGVSPLKPGGWINFGCV